MSDRMTKLEAARERLRVARDRGNTERSGDLSGLADEVDEMVDLAREATWLVDGLAVCEANGHIYEGGSECLDCGKERGRR